MQHASRVTTCSLLAWAKPNGPHIIPSGIGGSNRPSFCVRGGVISSLSYHCTWLCVPNTQAAWWADASISIHKSINNFKVNRINAARCHLHVLQQTSTDSVHAVICDRLAVGGNREIKLISLARDGRNADLLAQAL